MSQHLSDEWTYNFGQATRLFGYCSYTKKKITLSEPLVLLNSEEEVTNTILHEIAHAMTGKIIVNGRVMHHGSDWVRTARSIGCTGDRCYGSHVKTPSPRYLAVCSRCHSKREYQRKRKLACGNCCRKHNGGKFSERFLLIWKRRKSLALQIN